jgi:hypothetical protein
MRNNVRELRRGVPYGPPHKAYRGREEGDTLLEAPSEDAPTCKVYLGSEAPDSGPEPLHFVYLPLLEIEAHSEGVPDQGVGVELFELRLELSYERLMMEEASGMRAPET